MKSKIYFLSILILFQSCYSYKTFDINNYEVENPKKVKIILKDSQRIKGEVIDFNNDKIIVKKITGTLEIPISEIEKIKKGEPDWLKSFALTYVIFLGVLIYGFVELIKSL
tara:strand:- start:78 stop:410 length:333 start_codon:yes stop_codon:yes gene_type:complete